MFYRKATQVILLHVVLLGGSCPVVAGEAISLLRVRMGGSPEAGGLDRRGYEVFKQTQAQLVRSPFVLRAALRDLENRDLKVLRDVEQPLQMLQSGLQVDYPGKSEIMRVSLSGDRTDAVSILDAVVKAYLEEVMQANRTELVRRLEMLRKTHRDNQRRLRELTEKEHALQTELGSTDSEVGAVLGKLRLQSLVAAQQRVEWLRQQKLEAEIQQQILDELRDSLGDDQEARLRELKVRNAILAEHIEKHQAQLEHDLENLHETQGFSSDLEVLRVERGSLEANIMEIAAEVKRVEIELQQPPVVTLVQPAIYLQ